MHTAPHLEVSFTFICKAEFILLIEKEAAYMRLAEDRFYQRYPCIVITAKGAYPMEGYSCA